MEEQSFEIEVLGEKYRGHYIKRVESASEVLAALTRDDGKLFGLDTETEPLPKYSSFPKAALSPHLSRIRLLQVFDGRNSCVFDLKYLQGVEHSFGADLIRFLEEGRFIGHNSVFDLQYVLKMGVKKMNIGCTLLLAKILNHATSPVDIGLSLELLVEKVLKIPVNKAGQKSDWSSELTFEQIQYAALDPLYTYLLAEKLAPGLKKYGLERIYKLYKDAQQVVAKMQLNGLAVDVEAHRENIARWREELYVAKEDVLELTGLKKLTGATLASWLDENLDEETLRIWPQTETGRLKTDSHVFADFSHLPIADKFERYQKLDKLLSAFGDRLIAQINPETKRLHASYKIAGARTGRMSCTNPNIQQSPKDKTFRDIFVPSSPGNVFVSADFSQVELRCVAEIAQDPAMLQAYRSGADLHSLTASKISKKPLSEVTKSERQLAKACFSGDVEILTPFGFTKFKDLSKCEQVFQYSLPWGVPINPSSKRQSGRYTRGYIFPEFNGVGGRLDIVNQLAFKKLPNRHVVLVEDRNTALEATPDHEIVYINNQGTVKKQSICEIREIRNWINAGWGDMDESAESPEFTRLLAMTIADGSFYRGKTIRFGFSKRRKYRRCLELFARYGIRAKQRKTSNGVVAITVTDEELVKKMLTYCNPAKYLNVYAVSMLPRHIFLEEAAFWDSHVLKGETRDRVLFSSTVEGTVDTMQMMCAMNGIPSVKSRQEKKADNHKTVHKLSYPLKSNPLSRASFKVQDTGKICDVYCVQVPSGMIVIRYKGKVSIQGNCNFGLLFGLGKAKFSQYARNSYKVEVSESEASESIEVFRETYPQVREWQLKQSENCKQYLKTKTPCGKVVRLSKDNYYGTGLNVPVQGSAAEIMLHALIRFDMVCDEYGWKLVNTVHDEITVECPREDIEACKKALEEEMTFAFLDVFPQGITKNLVEAKHGNSWGECK